jgi:hypothetical protein
MADDDAELRKIFGVRAREALIADVNQPHVPTATGEIAPVDGSTPQNLLHLAHVSHCRHSSSKISARSDFALARSSGLPLLARRSSHPRF